MANPFDLFVSYPCKQIKTQGEQGNKTHKNIEKAFEIENT